MIQGQKSIGIKKRHMKIFKSFTKSVLPVLFSDPLWHLPSTFKWSQPMQSRSNQDDKVIHDSVFKYSEHDIIPTSHATKGFVSHSNEYDFASNISAAALHGNALIQVVLMQMIKSLSSILETDFIEYMPAVLYPLLQKTSDINCNLVQTAALETLTAVSLSSGYTSFDEMLSIHFRYIIEVFSSELQGPFLLKSEQHLRQQAVCFYSLHTVVKLILQSLIQKREVNKSSDHSSDVINETQIVLLIDMVQSINTWFNINFRKSVMDLVTLLIVPLGMLKVFNGCIEYMDSVLQVSFDMPKTPESHDDSPWIHLLLQFECDTDNHSDDEPTILNGRQGFQQHLSTQDHENDTKPVEELSKEIKPVLSGETLGRLVSIIRQVMLTNSVFVSTPDLKLQRESCDLFNRSFHLLYTIQLHSKVS
jgi:hypothetical protein